MCWFMLFIASILMDSPRIELFEHFLSDRECDYIIEKGRPQLMRSRVFTASGEVQDNRRTSEGMFFPQNSNDPILSGIEERIASLTRIPRSHGEGIQLLHYGVGAEYQPHYDYFDCSTGGCDRGGQRVATMILYLNDVEEGGETIFPRAKVSVKPVKGSAVLFYNCLPGGKEDPNTLHGGAPVIKGEKWIATKWLRMGVFR